MEVSQAMLKVLQLIGMPFPKESILKQSEIRLNERWRFQIVLARYMGGLIIQNAHHWNMIFLLQAVIFHSVACYTRLKL